MIIKWSLYFFVFALVLYLGKGSFAVPMDREIQKTLTRLEKAWEIQEKEIATANIKFRQAHGQTIAPPLCRAVSPQEALKIIDAIDYSDPSTAFDSLVKQLLIDYSYISAHELYYSYPKTLLKTKVSEINRQYIKNDLEEYVVLFDGKDTIRVDPLNNQIDVTLGGFPYSLFILRSPPFILPLKIRDTFSFQKTEQFFEITTVDENSGSKIVVDIEDGLLYYRSVFLKDDGKIGKNLGRDRFQRCFFSSPGGIVFPRVSVEINYENDVANVIDIYLIEESVFNNVIDDSVFKVSAPEKTHVWDYRYNENRPAFNKLQSDTEDVMTVVGDYVDYSYKNNSGGRNLIILIVINAFILLIIAWRIYNQRKK
jgi:hypothetical protein